jgi:hypothetical protein
MRGGASGDAYEVAQLPEGAVVFAANDDVVEHLYLEHLSCADEIAGDADVCLRWVGSPEG